MTVHQRLDDSRPRGLASECICGRPACTRWYADQVVEALGVDIDLNPHSHAWRSERRASASGRLHTALVAFCDVLGGGLVTLALFVWLVYLR